MKYKEIVSVTGLSGLYQLLTTKSDGAIVRNVGDKTTKFISARQHNVTPLDSIEVYTINENIRLEEVFHKMRAQEVTLPPAEVKLNVKEDIQRYFRAVVPELDEDRVYVSDMKKMLKWYDLLTKNELIQPLVESEPSLSGEDLLAEDGLVAPTVVGETVTETDEEGVSETEALTEGDEEKEPTA